MKNILLLAIVLFTTCLSAQESMNIAQDSVAYLTAEQEAFMIDKETKYLFKTSPLQYEQKLSEAFSVNLSAAPGMVYGREVTATTDETFLSSIYLQTEAELRYYYKLPRLIKESKQANNLSSSYFGFGGRFGKTVYESDRAFTNTSRSSYQLYGAWGDQKRFLNFGYLDYGIELSYQSSSFDNSLVNEGGAYSNITLRTRTKVGFAFGQNYDINEEAKCPIFRCYLDRKSALKLNYNSLFAISYGKNLFSVDKNQLQMRINPNIAYEVKLGSSSFSINQDLDISVSLSNTEGADRNAFGVSVFTIDYSVGGRYYYNLKSNISKGRSGNNLSGGYVFLRTSYNRFATESTLTGSNGQPYETDYEYEHINVESGIGFQKTVLNDLYFDLQFGFTREVVTFGRDDRESSPTPVILDLFGRTKRETLPIAFLLDFKVGKMF